MHQMFWDTTSSFVERWTNNSVHNTLYKTHSCLLIHAKISHQLDERHSHDRSLSLETVSLQFLPEMSLLRTRSAMKSDAAKQENTYHTT